MATNWMGCQLLFLALILTIVFATPSDQGTLGDTHYTLSIFSFLEEPASSSSFSIPYTIGAVLNT